MHPQIERFMERPRGQKVAAWVGSLLLVFGLFWMYGIGPVSKNLQKQRDEEETLETQLAQERRIARNLSKFRNEVKVLDADLEVVLRELPDQKEIPDLLQSISDLARDAGLEVSFFKPRMEVSRDFYAEVPVEINIDGSYHQIATFFDEVGRLPRIVNVQQINLHDAKVTPETVTMKASCLATTFRYLSEEERRAQKQAAGKKRRRR